jgi:hypothetical protein
MVERALLHAGMGETQMHDWNEFNRELQNRVSDPGTRYCLGLIYERLLDIAKQMDMCANVTTEMASVMNNFVSMNEAFDDRLKQLHKHIKGDTEGVELRSVPLTNDDFN